MKVKHANGLPYTALLMFLLCGGLLPMRATATVFDHNHTAWDGLLKTYVTKDGSVRYQSFRKAQENLSEHAMQTYMTLLAAVKLKEFESWSREQQMAFLINAYNAFTIQLIIDHPGVSSIRKIKNGWFGSPWSKPLSGNRTLLDGAIAALDPIEHEWLRPKYRDFRIHAAVNCASISCPPLRSESYTADKLETQLDEQMQIWLADTTKNQFMTVGNPQILISKIFAPSPWYQKDFDDWGGSVRAVLTKFGPKAAADLVEKGTSVDYLDYNWDLNAAAGE